MKTILLGILLLFSGCTTEVTVVGSIPTPIVDKMPLNLAVYYEDSFKDFSHSEALPGSKAWKINFGEQNLILFRNLMNAMFDSVVELDSPALSKAQEAKFDGIIIPSVEKYEFLTPSVSGLKYYSVSIHYQITIMGNKGQKLMEYKVIAYGKNGLESSGASALGEATMSAIRDGGTRIATELRAQPEIIHWLQVNKAGSLKTDNSEAEKPEVSELRAGSKT